MKQKREMDSYIRQYPHILRWINECPACHTRGYMPDMPAMIVRNGIETAETIYIRKFFKPLEVDDLGLCPQCSKQFHKQEKPHQPPGR